MLTYVDEEWLKERVREVWKEKRNYSQQKYLTSSGAIVSVTMYAKWAGIFCSAFYRHYGVRCGYCTGLLYGTYVRY